MCRLPCVSVCCTGVGLAPCAQCVAGLLAGEGGRKWYLRKTVEERVSFVQDDICSECECSHAGDKKVEFAELGPLS